LLFLLQLLLTAEHLDLLVQLLDALLEGLLADGRLARRRTLGSARAVLSRLSLLFELLLEALELLLELLDARAQRILVE
jgi:hypothetical protein